MTETGQVRARGEKAGGAWERLQTLREAAASAFLSLPSDRQAGILCWPSLQGDAINLAERALLERFRPSGVVLFRRNLSSLIGAQSLVAELRGLLDGEGASPFPLARAFVGIDEEGGRVSRLPAPFPRGLSAFQAATSDPDFNALASQALHQAAMARALGVNVIFAPVADVLTEPKNAALGDRCFSSEAGIVALAALRVFEILAAQGVLACAKHFPGHGNTLQDTHDGLAESDVAWETLRAREWLPFRKLIEAGIPLCMSAHVVLPQLSAKPATFEPLLLDGVLRQELGFHGLVVSDDLRMRAIAQHLGVDIAQAAKLDGSAFTGAADAADAVLGRAACMALEAGCDVVLACQGIEREAVLLDAVSQRLGADSAFRAACAVKAGRIAAAAALPEARL